ncbi:phosphotransferase [Heliobacterium gestii]|uniref:Phosphotransferase n=1 Tax=Heliomicrobium gestii TaxID=2699 RepID=A0A845L9T3_HELGE|nr:phosphotransferase [Heliomicrobium gestii]MBM7865170.1 Ser/Thr protein kinase RdoA (MazF antagonist) [Heliomicrobium gestii]MZP41439.1 phosphotransferase [Heliomicrobium gestii]
MLVVNRYVGVDPRFQNTTRKARTRRPERRSPERTGTLADQREIVPDLPSPLFDALPSPAESSLPAPPFGSGNPLPPLDLEPLEQIFPDTPPLSLTWEEDLADGTSNIIAKDAAGSPSLLADSTGAVAATPAQAKGEGPFERAEQVQEHRPIEGLPNQDQQGSLIEEAETRSGKATLAPDLRVERERLLELLAEHDLHLRSLHRQGGRLLAETDRGPLRVEFVEGEKALLRARNVVAALQHLREKGFPQCPEPRLSKYGEWVIPWGDRAYFLYHKLPGRSAKLDSSADLREAGRVLALLHRSGRGFQPADASVAGPIDIPGQFAWGRQVAADWQAMVGRQRFFSDSDRLLQENLPKLTERAEKGFAWMESAYGEKRQEIEQAGALCHGHFGAASLLKTQRTFWVDCFNHCRRDIPVAELAQFVYDTVRASRDGWKEAIHIIEGYDSVEKLSESDWRLLLGCLIIPFDLFEHLEGKIRTEPAQTIEIIPDRRLQDQGFRRTRRAIETCNRAYAAAFRMASQAGMTLPT